MALQTPGPISPWTVRKAKRSASEPVQRHRKRTRFSIPATTGRDRRKQQTLTQTQWVPRAHYMSFEDRDDKRLAYLQHSEETEPAEHYDRSLSIEARLRTRANGKGKRITGLNRRDSTLTQMRFFNLEMPVMKLDEDEYLGDEPEAATDDMQVSRDPKQGTAQPGIPQMDGGYESPRKRKPKRAFGTELPQKVRRADPTSADDDYHPSKRSKFTAKKNDSERRRTSDRIRKKVLSDPEQNLEYFNAVLADDPNPTPTILKEKFQLSALEIQNTSDCDDVEGNANHYGSVRQPLRVPKTPQKRREVIPSSQSPESLPPSTMKKSVVDLPKPARFTPRVPLRDVSSNTPRSRNPAIFGKSSDKIPSLQSTVSPSPKRKICILKLPKKSLHTKKARVEDSQRNIWSVQVITSPRLEKESPDKVQNRQTGKLEIEESKETGKASQSQFDLDEDVLSTPEKSLQSLSAVFGTSRKNENSTAALETSHNLIPQKFWESEIIIRDFAAENPAENNPKLVSSQHETARFPDEKVFTVNNEDDMEHQETDDSDFGTPIANDTQFNLDLANRIPISPVLTKAIKSAEESEYRDEVESNSAGDDQDSDSLPLPVPTLIHNSTSTRVPLNDIVPPSSSSQVLPIIRTPTQRSNHPASLPHQSQISTQEPTQGYLPMSSVRTYSAPDASQENEPDHISIKDSSSVRIHLSQMPLYAQDDEDDGMDLDLDNYVNEQVGDGDDEHDLEQVDMERENDSQIPPQLSSPHHLLSSEAHHPRPFPVADELASQTEQPSLHLNRRIPSQEAECETQSNFTQGGHVTASRIARMKTQGLIPQDYIPRADFRVPTDPRELLPAWVFEGLDDSDEEDGL